MESSAARVSKKIDYSAGNTRRAAKKTYNEEINDDVDSEEDFAPPKEEDSTSNATAEDTAAPASRGKLKTMKSPRKSSVSPTSQTAARAWGGLQVYDTSSKSSTKNHFMYHLPEEVDAHTEL